MTVLLSGWAMWAVAADVTDLTLINVSTNLPMVGYDPLPTGSILNLSLLPSRSLNIRANVNGAVGSVLFTISGQANHIENTAPYSCFQDTNGIYTAWTPTVGVWTITATAYTLANATGTAGVTVSITFTVGDAYTSNNSGNWDDVTRWTPTPPTGGPGIADSAIIAGTHVMSLNAVNRLANQLQFLGGGQVSGANTLTMGAPGIVITGTGAPTISCTTLAFGGTLAMISTSSSGTLTISSIITGSAGLTKTGTGVMALSGASTYTGATSISAGTLRLSGATGAIASSTPVAVESGATLDIDNTSTSADRLADAGTLTMKGGTFSWTTNAVRTETISVMSFTKGHTKVAFTAVTGGPTLTATGGVLRSNAATMEFNRGPLAGPNGSLKWTGATIGLTRWTVVEQDYVQTGNYDATNGLVQLGTGTQYTLNAGAGTWGTNTRWTPTGIPGGGDHVVMQNNTKAASNSAQAVTSYYGNNPSGTSTGSDGTIALTINGNIYARNTGRVKPAHSLNFGTNEAVFINTGTGSNSGIVNWGDVISMTCGSITVSGTSVTEFNANLDGNTSVASAGTTAYTGTIEVAGGTCRAGWDAALGTAAGGTLVDDGATLEIGNSGNDGYRSSPTGITYAVAEPLTLNGLGVGGAGALICTQGTSSFAGPITLASAASVAAAAGLTFTLGGVISGGNALSSVGAGTVVLSGNNTYAGATTVTAGTVSVTNAAGLGTTAAGTAVASGACLDLNGVAVGAEAVSLDGTGIAAGGAMTGTGTASLIGTVTLVSDSSVGGTGTLTLSGIVGGGFALTKVGSGTAVLGAANIYTGVTTVSTGTLSVTNASGLGTTAGGTSVTGGACLDLNGAAVGAETVTLNGSGIASAGALTGTGTASLSGGVTLGSDSTIGGSGTLTVSGVVGGGFALTKAGSGVLILNATNTWGGATTISAGTLRVAGGLAIPDGSTVTIANLAATSLDLNGSSERIGALAGGGATGGAVTLGTGTLTIGGAATATFDGVISGAGGALTVTGTAVQTLTRTSTYSGLTTIAAGTLDVNSPANNSSSNVSLTGTGTIGGTGRVGTITSVGGSSGTNISPGIAAAKGTFQAGTTNLASGTNPTVTIRIAGFATPGTDYDRLDLLTAGGALTLGGSSKLVVDLAGVPYSGTASGVITCSGTPTGTFASVSVINAPATFTASASYANGSVSVLCSAPLTQVANTGVPVASGGAVTIESTALQYTQSLSTSSQIVYTVTAVPTHGALRKNLVAIANSGTFTQADIDGNLMSYEHGDLANTSDSFTATVTGLGPVSGSVTCTITVTGTGLANGLVAYFPFEQTSGVTVPDKVGAGAYTGTVVGTPAWSAGRIGNALSFDGTTTWVALPPGMANFNTGLTVSLWANPTAISNWARFIDFGDVQDSGPNIVFSRFASSSDLNCTSSTAVLHPSGGIINSTWHQYQWTITNTGTGTLYVDGTLLLSSAQAVPTPVLRNRNRIGQSSWLPDALFQGAIDELRIYNRGLSGGECRLLALQAAPTTTNLDGNSLAYAGNSAAVALDVGGDATVNDNDDLYESGGFLLVGNTFANATSTLSIAQVGGITTAGGVTAANVLVSNGGNVIGRIDATLDGAAGRGLKVAFTTIYASPAAEQALVRAIRFADTATAGITRTFTFTFDDALATPTPATVTMTENGPLTMSTNTGLTVAAGGVVTVANTALAASGADTAANRTFTVSQLPSSGALWKSNAVVILSGTFTQADIDGGLIRYEQGDLSSSTDSFVVAVADTLTHTVAPTRVSVTATGSGLGFGLVGYWPLDEGSGTTSVDRTGDNYTATLVAGGSGPPAWGAGKIGSSLGFAAASYASIARPIQDDFSIAFWFNSNSTFADTAAPFWYGGAGLVDGDMPGYGNDFGTSYVNAGFIRAGVGNYLAGSADMSLTSLSGYNDNAWHQVVVTRSNSASSARVLTLQVDGNYGVGSGVANGATLNASANLVFGRIQAGNGFTGSLDDIRMFNRVLTGDEIAALKNGTGDAAPVISNLSGDTMLMPGPGLATPIDVGGDATVSDTDDQYFSGGWLLVENFSGMSGSVLSIATAGGITVTGSTVSSGGNAIGTIDATLSGSAGSNLRVFFTTRFADATAVAALIHALRYSDGATSPTDRSLRTTLFDGLFSSSAISSTQRRRHFGNVGVGGPLIP